ncbi:cell surface glycoprotein CD200 receptor 2-like [Heterodontus francisci]|uniref:cell surface glycoprotein CD200 receptor 2-like n=1 Tax=Heterodontus francisci TaxID=7792 RepID=UPI00355B114C
MNFFEIRFHSRKAVLVEIKSPRKRLQFPLLLLAIFIALAQPGFPLAEKLSTLLGNKVVFRCPFNGNVTMISWSFHSVLQNEFIAALRCDLNEMNKASINTRITIQNATCNMTNNEMNLQIEPVYLTDDGNYSCQIAGQNGVHEVTFSLSVTVPPAISFSIENKLNDTMMAICTASNGKPAAEITWHPHNLGNFTINMSHHSNRTVTVRSEYNITTHLFSEDVICIVSHPAFDRTQNYSIPQNSPGPDDSQSTPKNLFYIYLVTGILATCLCLLAVALFIVGYLNLQNQTAFRNCFGSTPSQIYEAPMLAFTRDTHMQIGTEKSRRKDK